MNFISDIYQNFLAELSTNQFLSAGVILGGITSVLIYFKKIPANIWSRIVRLIKFNITIEERTSGMLFEYLENWIRDNLSKSYRNVDAAYYSDNDNESNSLEKREDAPPISSCYPTMTTPQKIIFKQRDDFFYLFRSGRLIKISKNKEKLQGVHNIQNLFYDTYTINSVFAKSAIQKFLQEVVDYNISLQKIKKTINIFTNSSRYIEKINEIMYRNIDSVYINPILKNNLVSDIKKFILSKDWYLEKGIKYKRSYLFYGSPGNGKTSMVIALATLLKKDINFINLIDFQNDSDLIYCFSKAKGIVVVEDIDRFLKNTKIKISLSGLLNVVEGIYSPEGNIYIFTTNHIDKIDEALKRNGRMDMWIEFEIPNKEIVESYLSGFYKNDINIDFPYNPKLPMSSIQEICIRNQNNSEIALENIRSRLMTNNIPKILINA